MGRKHLRRKVVAPVAPRGLRPRLLPRTVKALAMAHIVNLDDIAHGRASAEVMWQTMGGVLTWLRVAGRLGQGFDEMQAQHDLMLRVVARYVATGKVVFTGPDYQLAKQGVMVMDKLAELVDQHTATAAAEWSEARIATLTKQAEQAQHQGATS